VEKIWTRRPDDLFSASPNALAFDKTGKRLFVSNATQNAVGIIKFDPSDKESALLGLIPVGWFPGALVHDAARNQINVANIKGIGSTRRLKPGDKVKFNSKDYFGTLSLVPVPAGQGLRRVLPSRLHQYPVRCARCREASRATRPARAPCAGAGWRAERFQARRLHHQGEPHLRSDPR
jgi:hypothetical protein